MDTLLVQFTDPASSERPVWPGDSGLPAVRFLVNEANLLDTIGLAEGRLAETGATVVEPRWGYSPLSQGR